MKRLVLAALALGLAVPVSQAWAQTAAPAAAQQNIWQSCLAEGKARGLTGAALVDAQEACVVKARPAFAVDVKCRKDARAQGLKGEAMRNAVVACIDAAAPARAVLRKCRAEGVAKGLKDKDLTDYVRTCRTGH